MTRKIALAGIGKIARDAHLPALAASGDWELAATISRSGGVDGVPGYRDMDAFLAADTGIDCVSLALPPGPRFAYAEAAIGAGLHVMLEKPPAATLAQCRRLAMLAEAKGVSLHATWHSRMGAAVAETARRLRGARIEGLTIDWREDVREWHPGQDWVWEAGNFGVFDPGINAFSILTEILDRPVWVERSVLRVPEGREAPISADLAFGHPDGGDLSMRLGWDHEGPAVWDIVAETDRGRFELRESAGRLWVNGDEIACPSLGEYPALYDAFAALVRAGLSETDFRPMELAADAFLMARFETAPPFSW